MLLEGTGLAWGPDSTPSTDAAPQVSLLCLVDLHPAEIPAGARGGGHVA